MRADRLNVAKRALLAALGGCEIAVPQAAWPSISQMARQHRLEPLLHYRIREGALGGVPAEFAEECRQAYRRAATDALVKRAALRALAATLDAAGIAHVALKGSAVAWEAWPEPALRPMRDVDVLVPREALFVAADALLANGFEWTEGAPASSGSAAFTSKHLPPLTHAVSGTLLEVHHALTDNRHARVGGLEPSAMLARARPAGDGSAIRHPDPADQFAHMAIHAVDVHRFDCGPLALADCHFLLEKGGFDPVALADRARAEGWLRPAQLLCALTARWFPGTEVPAAFRATDIPEPVLAAADDALLMDFEQRQLADLASDVGLTLDPRKLVAGLRRRGSERPTDPAGKASLTHRVGRIARVFRQLANARARNEAKAAATVSVWAREPGHSGD